MALFRATTDRLFLRFCRTGDAAALGQVFDRTAAELLRVACYLCGNRTDAEDLVQRTFLAAIESRASYDPKRRAVPWLLGILANHQRRLLRERRRPTPIAGDDPAHDPASAAAQRELDETLVRLRAELGEPYGEVLRLHLEQGLNAKEIAASLQRPAGTVRTQLMRALELLRQRLPNGFVAGMVPWLPSGAGLATVRSAVLQAARTGTTSTAAGASVAAAGTVVGGMWMSQKFLIAVPVLLAALSLTGYALWNPGAEVPLPNGEHSARVDSSAPEHATTARVPADTLVADQREAVVPSSLPTDTSDPGFAAVAVRVRWEDDGSPAANVGVLATNGQTVQQRDAVTGPDGTCTLLHLAPGSWQITASLSDAAQSISLRADEHTSLDLSARREAAAKGLVVDDMDRPIRNARIWMSLDGDSMHGHEVAKTDVDGHFEVPFHGARHLGARHPDYAPSHTQIIDPGNPASLQVTLHMQQAGGTVRGTVRDARGDPIAWAKVLVGEDHPHFLNRETAPTAERLPRGIEVTSDRSGHYEVHGAPAGLCQIRAWAHGFAPFSSGTEIPARGTAELPIVLQPGAAVRGHVRDENGAAIVGAQVHWQRDQFAEGRATSSADGSFACEDLPVGWVEFQIKHEGATDRTRLQLASGTTTTWDPVLGTSLGINGRLVDAQQHPLADHSITVYFDGVNPGPNSMTDADGNFELTSVGDKPVDVQIARSFEVLRVMHEVKPGTRNLLIQLTDLEIPSATIRGRVFDAQHLPVAATITPWREGAEQAVLYNCDAATGAFSIGPLRAGKYRLEVVSPKTGRQPGGNFELQPNETRDLGDIVLQETGSADLQITIDGKPAPGGLVFLVTEDGSWSDTATIENGQASAPALRVGRHFVHIEFQGLYQAGEVMVNPSATTQASFELQRTARVRVTVRGHDPATEPDALLTAFRADGTFAGRFGIAQMPGAPTFLVDLPLGRYRFVVRCADGRTVEMPEQRLTSHTETRDATVDLPPPGK
jgi:RNA polymerase sigma factor (sigma-70 family)